MGGAASSQVELCLEKGSSSVYGRREPPVPKTKERYSKKSKLSPLRTSTGNKREKTRRAVKVARKTV